MAQAIGMVQTGHRLGPAVGPVIGGLLAPIVGLRNAFLFASAFYVVALIAIIVFYKEPRESNAPRKMRGGRAVLTHLFQLPGFLLALGVIFGLQTVDRFWPVLPLYVAQVGVSVSDSDRDRRAVFPWRNFGGVRSPPRGALLMNRRPARTVIVAVHSLAAAAVAAILVAPSLWFVGASMLLFGVSVGVATTTVYAVAGSSLPPDAHATGSGS
jgi:DHA1 family multidrug resistance protein-like MFS transporter